MIIGPNGITPNGQGKMASKIRNLERLIKRLTPTGQGVSHGPSGTSIRTGSTSKRGGSSSAPSWL